MRTIIAGIVGAIVLGVVAAFVLSGIQEPAYQSYSTTSARIGDPGTNLVGESWSGNPRLRHEGS